MTEEKYRTHEICQFDYSDIWEKSFDERYTDTPLRNDEVVALLNNQNKVTEELKNTINDLKECLKLNKRFILYWNANKTVIWDMENHQQVENKDIYSYLQNIGELNKK